jgi:hypothetical protein
MALAPDAIKALEAQHGPLLVIDVASEADGRELTLAFRAATSAHWRRLSAADKRLIAGDDSAASAPELIARELLVHPDRPAFDALRDDAPWIAEQAGRELVGRFARRYRAAVGES